MPLRCRKMPCFFRRLQAAPQGGSLRTLSRAAFLWRCLLEDRAELPSVGPRSHRTQQWLLVSVGVQAYPIATLQKGDRICLCCATGTVHEFVGTLPLPADDIGLAEGCCGDGYAISGAPSFTGVTQFSEAGFPFVMVSACIQSSTATNIRVRRGGAASADTSQGA